MFNEIIYKREYIQEINHSEDLTSFLSIHFLIKKVCVSSYFRTRVQLSSTKDNDLIIYTLVNIVIKTTVMLQRENLSIYFRRSFSSIERCPAIPLESPERFSPWFPV